MANLSCNSSRTTGPRREIVDNLRKLNPDLLFFGGDQTYRHTEHTAGWIEFGLQYRDIIRDRPTVSIPDDHDVGHPNVWGENGKRSTIPGDADGGYRYPVAYVNQVQRQQTWNLPDPVDPDPIGRDIGVYFTRLHIGGIDFAILEDRKFKTGPAGKIPKMGPRPDHINDPAYDPKTIDLPGLELLGPRQERFLENWSSDWVLYSHRGGLAIWEYEQCLLDVIEAVSHQSGAPQPATNLIGYVPRYQKRMFNNRTFGALSMMAGSIGVFSLISSFPPSAGELPIPIASIALSFGLLKFYRSLSPAPEIPFNRFY